MSKDSFYLNHYAKSVTLDDRIKKLLKMFKKLRVNRFLDVGCGDGSLTLLLKEACHASEVYGVEISLKGVEEATLKGIKCFKLDVDKDDFPFRDHYFDLVFAGEIIEHLFNPDHFLHECYRILKLRGTLIITTPNLGAWYNRLTLLMGYQPYTVSASLENYWVGKPFKRSSSAGREHIRFFTLRALKQLLEVHGFEIKQTLGAHTTPFYAPLRMSIMVKNIDKTLSKIPSLSTYIIVKCLKP